jgi:Mce-associated membrane protein
MVADRPAHRLSARWLRLPERAALAGLSLVLVALLAVAAALGTRVRRADADRSRQQAILAAARHMVVDFTTLDYRHGQADVQRVLDEATGDFERELADGSGQLRQLIAANRSVSRGEILEAGLVSRDADSARVLVVADSMVRNTSAPNGQRRHYRIQLDLRREGGRWLVSSLEFVA